MTLILRHRRTSQLGRLGETLAQEALKRNGFDDVIDLNLGRNNHPFADIRARREGTLYLISVKTRNRRRDNGRLNESYNCVQVSKQRNDRLKSQGKTTREITAIAIDQVRQLAIESNSVAAWVAVSVCPKRNSYAVYFGQLDLLRGRAIAMTPEAIGGYECLTNWTVDKRIGPELSNDES